MQISQAAETKQWSIDFPILRVIKTQAMQMIVTFALDVQSLNPCFHLNFMATKIKLQVSEASHIGPNFIPFAGFPRHGILVFGMKLPSAPSDVYDEDFPSILGPPCLHKVPEL